MYELCVRTQARQVSLRSACCITDHFQCHEEIATASSQDHAGSGDGRKAQNQTGDRLHIGSSGAFAHRGSYVQVQAWSPFRGFRVTILRFAMFGAH